MVVWGVVYREDANADADADADNVPATALHPVLPRPGKFCATSSNLRLLHLRTASASPRPGVVNASSASKLPWRSRCSRRVPPPEDDDDDDDDADACRAEPKARPPVLEMPLWPS